ncbi:hypothetical protein QBC35DRAFT_477345 [Podospora australis]|uniref:Uncharacterized protein n=1 Tax=Podospora australis TaxID=1536484 RepID=A0AAN6WN21_9PEZI|nr:hypothetical protein QBC35DRAFT_477345 [Podospora australis]
MSVWKGRPSTERCARFRFDVHGNDTQAWQRQSLWTAATTITTFHQVRRPWYLDQSTGHARNNLHATDLCQLAKWAIARSRATKTTRSWVEFLGGASIQGTAMESRDHNTTKITRINTTQSIQRARESATCKTCVVLQVGKAFETQVSLGYLMHTFRSEGSRGLGVPEESEVEQLMLRLFFRKESSKLWGREQTTRFGSGRESRVVPEKRVE